jgi:DNA-directed RNA polymerase specialized sigma24 family protein
MKDGGNSGGNGMLALDSAYNLARFLSRDAGAAEHIVHAAYLQVRRTAEAGRNELLKSVRRCYRTWLTARRKSCQQDGRSARTSLPDAIAGSVLRSDDDKHRFTGLAGADLDATRFVIEAMPRRLREILVLKELEKLSYREIAEVTSLQTGQVMLRLASARRLLARSFPESTDPDCGENTVIARRNAMKQSGLPPRMDSGLLR